MQLDTLLSHVQWKSTSVLAVLCRAVYMYGTMIINYKIPVVLSAKIKAINWLIKESTKILKNAGYLDRTWTIGDIVQYFVDLFQLPGVVRQVTDNTPVDPKNMGNVIDKIIDDGGLEVKFDGGLAVKQDADKKKFYFHLVKKDNEGNPQLINFPTCADDDGVSTCGPNQICLSPKHIALSKLRVPENMPGFPNDVKRFLDSVGDIIGVCVNKQERDGFCLTVSVTYRSLEVNGSHIAAFLVPEYMAAF